jgi:hypothetical protein
MRGSGILTAATVFVIPGDTPVKCRWLAVSLSGGRSPGVFREGYYISERATKHEDKETSMFQRILVPLDVSPRKEVSGTHQPSLSAASVSQSTMMSGNGQQRVRFREHQVDKG